MGSVGVGGIGAGRRGGSVGWIGWMVLGWVGWADADGWVGLGWVGLDGPGRLGWVGLGWAGRPPGLEPARRVGGRVSRARALPSPAALARYHLPERWVRFSPPPPLSSAT